MTAGEAGNERLRRAFDAATEPTGPRGSCPSDEEIWRAARGELEPARKRELLDHLLECDACAESCRVASELISQQPGGLPAGKPVPAPHAPRWERRPRAAPGWIWIALPTAALLISGFVWIGPFDRRGGTPVEEYRAPGAATIESRLDEAIPVPRDRCVLQWTAGPEGTLYSVAISSESLTVLARADELDQPSYTVPASALEALPPGATILWRVEALLPDATRATSPVFRAKLE